MGLGTGATAAIVGGIGAAGSVASGLIGANAAGSAASTQANAANNAAQLEAQTANNALDFNKLQYGNSLNLLSPFYNTGVSANNRLAFLMGLNPAQGLPAGVVNPNSTASSLNPTGAGGGGTGHQPILAPGLPAVDTLGSGFSLPSTQPQSFNAESGQVPMLGSSPANPASGNALNTLAANGNGTVPISGSPANPSAGALNPNDPSQTSTVTGAPGQMPISGGGTIDASTNVGGTAQVPINQVGAPGSNGFGSLAQGWNQTFSSPTDVTEQNDPGYQFRLQQGQQALQNSAAARGGLLSGGTAKALSDYNQNAASAEYGNVYNRALQNYNTNYNTFTNDQTNTFNRLMSLMGGGQTSANQLSASGLTAANNAGNIGLTAAGNIGQQYNNAGAATASGYVGGANAITGGINNAMNSLSLLALLNKGGTGSNPNAGNGVI